MITKEKTKARVEPGQEAIGKEREKRLDRELADTFPASDPPSVTQPGVKLGAPEHKPASRK
jgi:hypothetical protein